MVALVEAESIPSERVECLPVGDEHDHATEFGGPRVRHLASVAGLIEVAPYRHPARLDAEVALQLLGVLAVGEDPVDLSETESVTILTSGGVDLEGDDDGLVTGELVSVVELVEQRFTGPGHVGDREAELCGFPV